MTAGIFIFVYVYNCKDFCDVINSRLAVLYLVTSFVLLLILPNQSR